MARWGMVINLAKCTRCHACVAACRIEHFLPLTGDLAQTHRPRDGRRHHRRRVHLPGQMQPVQRSALRRRLPYRGVPQARGRHRRHRFQQVLRLPVLRHRLPVPEPHLPFSQAESELLPRARDDQVREEGQGALPAHGRHHQKCNFCMERIDAGLEKGSRRASTGRPLRRASTSARPGPLPSVTWKIPTARCRS